MRKRILFLSAFLLACIGLSSAYLPALGSPAWTYSASITKNCDASSNNKSVAWQFTNQEPNTADNAMDITVQLAGQPDQVIINVLGGSTITGVFNLGSGVVPGSTVYFQMTWHSRAGTDLASRSFTSIANCYSTATSTTTAVPSATATNTKDPSPTPSNTVAPSQTPTNTSVPTDTPIPTDTSEPTATSSNTPPPTETEIASPTATETVLATTTATETPESTATATNTPVATPTATDTPLASATATNTAIPSSTASTTPQDTATVIPSATVGSSPTPTVTQTITQTPTETVTPDQTPTETVTPTETPFQPPTGQANCDGAVVINNSRSGISVVVYLDGIEKWHGDIGVFQTVGIGWNEILSVSATATANWTDNHGRSGSIGLGTFGPCVELPSPTPPVKVNSEGSAADEYAASIGQIDYPSLGLHIPIAHGFVGPDGSFHHALEVAGEVTDDDYGVHQSFAPILAQARPGDHLTINGQGYQVVSIVIVSQKNDRVMQRLLDGWTTITTCTPDGWIDNMVLLLMPIADHHEFFME